MPNWTDFWRDSDQTGGCNTPKTTDGFSVPVQNGCVNIVIRWCILHMSAWANDLCLVCGSSEHGQVNAHIVDISQEKYLQSPLNNRSRRCPDPQWDNKSRWCQNHQSPWVSFSLGSLWECISRPRRATYDQQDESKAGARHILLQLIKQMSQVKLSQVLFQCILFLLMFYLILVLLTVFCRLFKNY